MLELGFRNGPTFLLEGPYLIQIRKILHLVLQQVWCILQLVWTNPLFLCTMSFLAALLIFATC